MMDISKSYERDSFLSFLRDRFLPDDFESFEPNCKKVNINKSNPVITEAVKLGVCKSLDINVYEFKHNSGNDPRVTLSREAFGILNTDSMPNALAVFYNEDSSQWRLSLITSDYSLAKENRAEQTVSNPRRYSFLLGKGCKKHTPDEYLVKEGRIKEQVRRGKKYSPIEDLKYRFSVEVLTEDFYKHLFKWYNEWALHLVRYPEGTNNAVRLTNMHNEMHLIRLITRLIFVWFIKQKNLVPEWIFNETDIHAVLKSFHPQSQESGDYYNGILQNLFFATLNKEITEREFTKDKSEYGNNEFGINSYYRDRKNDTYFKVSTNEIKQKFADIPFLNGGLFECLDKTYENSQKPGFTVQEYHDGFSREKERCAFVPDILFFGNGENGNPEGLITLFNRYNFTVEENTPVDIDVALDPELLGKVFENLLGYYNEETRTTARKESGSFYTPREIVDYMVTESLTAYLANNNEKISKNKIEKLFSYSDEAPELDDNERHDLIKKIDGCKILDPACGSGAFPMGTLNKLSLALSKLDKDGKLWKERQEERARGDAASAFTIDDKNARDKKLKEISETFEFNQSKYGHKLYLIENCMFGVDIKPIAIQITKLRFFISLIVEQERDVNKPNFGIRALPNLETKFVCANTLIGLAEKNAELLDLEDDVIREMKSKLWNTRELHFYAKNAKQKRDLRKEDEKIRENISQYLLATSAKPNDKLIERNIIQIAELERKRELVKEENLVDVSNDNKHLFDNMNDGLPQYIDINAEKRANIDTEIKRLRDQNEFEKTKANNTSLKNDIQKISDWDPYDQNAEAAQFFDTYWMFGIKDGFDMVIGNPPYISTKGITSDYKNRLEKEYGFSDDTYNHFFFKGIKLIANNGLLTYITPKTFWTTQTKYNLRKLLLSKQIVYIFDTANPFVSVMVDTCITCVKNATLKTNEIKFIDGSKELFKPKFYTITQRTYEYAQNLVIFKPTDENLKIYKLYGEKVKELYCTWWDKISTSKNIAKNSVELEKYRMGLKPGDITLLGCLTEGGQGLATGNNGKYVAVRKSTKWAKNILESRPKKLAEAIKTKKIKIPVMSNFDNTTAYLSSLTEKEIAVLFDKLKEQYGRDIFGQGYLYRLIDDDEIADVDTLTADEKENGIDTSKKYYVPYDKGDKDGNRWYLETPFAIAWSKENVGYLQTDTNARFQGYMYFFREGFCWTNVLNPQARLLKAKLKKKTVNDVGAMSLFSIFDLTPNFYFVTLLNSEIVFNYYREFINCTVNIQINDIRQLPILIPTKEQLNICKEEFKKAVDLKKKYFDNFLQGTDIECKLTEIEHNLNRFIKNLYYSV